MTTDETCIVGIRTPKGNTVQGFNVCIRGEEVYTNYCDRSTPEPMLLITGPVSTT